MSEMEKAQILHDLKQNFNVQEEIFSQLLEQIKDPKLKDNFSRITQGLKVEDNYKMIFSALPWVKNINGLHQNQEKKHKITWSRVRLPSLAPQNQRVRGYSLPFFICGRVVKISMLFLPPIRHCSAFTVTHQLLYVIQSAAI
jgi:hypothetical protein